MSAIDEISARVVYRRRDTCMLNMLQINLYFRLPGRKIKCMYIRKVNTGLRRGLNVHRIGVQFLFTVLHIKICLIFAPNFRHYNLHIITHLSLNTESLKV